MSSTGCRLSSAAMPPIYIYIKFYAVTPLHPYVWSAADNPVHRRDASRLSTSSAQAGGTCCTSLGVGTGRALVKDRPPPPKKKKNFRQARTPVATTTQLSTAPNSRRATTDASSAGSEPRARLHEQEQPWRQSHSLPSPAPPHQAPLETRLSREGA